MIYALEHNFRMLFRHLSYEVNHLLGENITRSEFIFLRQLKQCGRQKVSDLAKVFQVSNSHATAVTEKLVDKQFAVRERSTTDRRVVELEITETGRIIFDQLEAKRLAYMYEVFDVLSNEEMTHLHEAIQKINDLRKKG